MKTSISVFCLMLQIKSWFFPERRRLNTSAHFVFTVKFYRANHKRFFCKNAEVAFVCLKPRKRQIKSAAFYSDCSGDSFFPAVQNTSRTGTEPQPRH